MSLRITALQSMIRKLMQLMTCQYQRTNINWEVSVYLLPVNCPKCTDIAKPLTKLTEHERIFVWDQDGQTLFKRSIVLTNIDGFLSKIQDVQERVIEYFSKTLTKLERNYCDTSYLSSSPWKHSMGESSSYKQTV